jgi:hypothetical protein
MRVVMQTTILQYSGFFLLARDVILHGYAASFTVSHRARSIDRWQFLPKKERNFKTIDDAYIKTPIT